MKNQTDVNLQEGTILIVDDEKDLIDVLTDCLSTITPKIKTAANGADALKLIQTGEIDAILSDVNMPIMSGLQLLAELRTQSILTPFVIITAFGDKKTLIEAIRLDATDFLDKPFELDDVQKIMKSALSLGLLQRQADKQIDLIYNSSNLPADEIARAKKTKKVLSRMRIETNIIKNKSNRSSQ